MKKIDRGKYKIQVKWASDSIFYPAPEVTQDWQSRISETMCYYDIKQVNNIFQINTTDAHPASSSPYNIRYNTRWEA